MVNCWLLFIVTIACSHASEDIVRVNVAPVIAGVSAPTGFDAGADGSLYDGDENTCAAAAAGEVTVQLDKLYIMTAVNVTLGAGTTASAVTVSIGATSSNSQTTECADGDEMADGRLECLEGIYGQFVFVTASGGGNVELCEISITGFDGVPEIDPAETSVVFYEGRNSETNDRVIGLQVTWATAGNIPALARYEYLYDLGPFSGGLQADLPPLMANGITEWGNELLLLEIHNFDDYYVNVTNVYIDPVSGTTLRSTPARIPISRGPKCVFGSCAGREACVEEYPSWLVSETQPSWVMGTENMCFLQRLYNSVQDGSKIDPPQFQYGAYLYGVQLGDPVQSITVPGDVTFENGRRCYQYCYGAMTVFFSSVAASLGLSAAQTEAVFTLALTDMEINGNNINHNPELTTGIPMQQYCDAISRQYCCEEDMCFTPHKWLDRNITLDTGCIAELLANPNYAFLQQCYYPQVFETSPINGDSSEVLMYVPTGMSYESVELAIYTTNDVMVRGPTRDTCAAVVGETNWFMCDLHDLDAGRDYYIYTWGQAPQLADGTGMTMRSTRFAFTAGDTLVVDCRDPNYYVEFRFGDIPKPEIKFEDLLAGGTLSADGAFSDQSLVQTNWVHPEQTRDPLYGTTPIEGPFIIEQSETRLFRGYPSSVHVQVGASDITALFFDYSFLDGILVHGDANAFDWLSTENVTLVNEFISEVSGTFDGGKLVAIGFKKQDGGGVETDLGCFAAAGFNCSGFTATPSDMAYYAVGFNGNVDANGDITSLTVSWAFVEIPEFQLIDDSCVFDTDPNFNDIQLFKWFYETDPTARFGDCGNVASFDTANKEIIYDNVVTHTDAVSGGVVTGEGGIQITRQSTFRMEIQCQYSAEDIVHNQFDTQEEGAAKVSGANELEFQLQIYPDQDFASPYGSDAVVHVTRGERFYFAASFQREYDQLSILAPECYAKKSATPGNVPGTDQFYTLETDGCPADDSFMREAGARTASLDAMSALGFAFTDAETDPVYIHCSVIACLPGDQACAVPTCDRRRARRSFTLPEGHKLHHVVSQPLLIKAAETGVLIHDSMLPEASSTIPAMGAVCLALLLLIAKMSHALVKSRREATEYRHAQIKIS